MKIFLPEEDVPVLPLTYFTYQIVSLRMLSARVSMSRLHIFSEFILKIVNTCSITNRSWCGYFYVDVDRMFVLLIDLPWHNASLKFGKKLSWRKWFINCNNLPLNRWLRQESKCNVLPAGWIQRPQILSPLWFSNFQLFWSLKVWQLVSLSY